MNDILIDYVTVDVAILAGTAKGSEKISIPEGRVIAMGAVVAGNTEDRIINLSVLQNHTEIIKAADVRFSAKTTSGNFKDSLRPVNFQGGRLFDTQLTANEVSNDQDVTVQVLFMIEKPY